MKDWRNWFLDRKKPLVDLYNEPAKVYGGVLLSTKHTMKNLDTTIHWLEPAIAGKKNLVRVIPVGIDRCFPHQHLLFSRDRHIVTELGCILFGFEDAYHAVPPGLLPSVPLATHLSKSSCSIALMMSMTHYLASKEYAPYLCVETEYQESIHDNYFESWAMRHEPLDFSFDWLAGIGKHNPTDSIMKWHKTLTKQQKAIPDVIDAYLLEDLVISFLKAIDILCYVLHGERRRKKREKKALALAETVAHPKWLTRKVKNEIECLCEFLLFWHDGRQCRFGGKRDPRAWLTEEEIARHLKWFKRDKITPDQVKVCRRMERIFGSDPSAVYREYFRDPKAGLRQLRGHLKDGDWRTVLSIGKSAA